MIKLFRKIRQRLLSENRFTKYMLYAVGEIVLVVIGIFIALQLNIWNEDRKTEEEIVAILTEVQNDLGSNILQSKDLIAYYTKKDSLSTLVISDRVTREDYLGRERWEFRNLALNARHLKIYNKGFLNLSQRLDEVPEVYKELIEPLNELYTYNKYEIDKFDLRIDKITDRWFDEMAATKPWFHRTALAQLEYPEEALEFYLRDPLYKNAVQVYAVAAENLMFHIRLFNIHAVKSYRRIRELTGLPEQIPDYIPHHLKPFTQAIYEDVVGKYKMIEWTDNGETKTDTNEPFTLRLGKDCLELVDEEYGDVIQLFFKERDVLYTVGMEVSIARNSEQEVTGLTVNGFDHEWKLARVE